MTDYNDVNNYRFVPVDIEQNTSKEPMYCPFCGGESVVSMNDELFTVVCYDCGAMGPLSTDAENAVVLWNHRLTPSIRKR